MMVKPCHSAKKAPWKASFLSRAPGGMVQAVSAPPYLLLLEGFTILPRAILPLYVIFFLLIRNRILAFAK